MLRIVLIVCVTLITMATVVPVIESFVVEKKEGYLNCVRKKPMVVLALAIAIVGAAVLHFCFLQNDRLVYLDCLQDQCVWYVVLLIATVDFFTKKIPNVLILGLFGVRIAFIIVSIAITPSQWSTIIGKSVIGLLIGLLFMGTCFLISRGGLGGGDVKLYSLLGLCYGLYGVITILLYSLLSSVIVGVILLVTHKAKFKSTMAMAPFALIGLTVFILLG